MTANNFIDLIPLWALFLIVAIIVFLSLELGWLVGDNRRKHKRDENDSTIAAGVGATMGLLAFLLAFTFGMSASRYDSRKQAVIQEANAIGTVYLRTDYLPEAQRSEARSLLRDYLVLRSGGASSIMNTQGMAKSADLQDKLWAIAAAAGVQSNTYTTGLFIQSLNDLIDLDTVRVAALRNRIPNSMWLMLGVVTIFSMAALGYEFGLSGKHNWIITSLLVIVFATTIMLIADQDLPQAGWLKVSQQPLLDLLNKLGAAAP